MGWFSVERLGSLNSWVQNGHGSSPFFSIPKTRCVERFGSLGSEWTGKVYLFVSIPKKMNGHGFGPLITVRQKKTRQAGQVAELRGDASHHGRRLGASDPRTWGGAMQNPAPSTPQVVLMVGTLGVGSKKRFVGFFLFSPLFFWSPPKLP